MISSKLKRGHCQKLGCQITINFYEAIQMYKITISFLDFTTRPVPHATFSVHFQSLCHSIGTKFEYNFLPLLQFKFHISLFIK